MRDKDQWFLESKATFLPETASESQDLPASPCEHLPTSWSATENTFETKRQLILTVSFANQDTE